MGTEIWTFKYQPDKFENMILSNDMKSVLGKVIKERPNIMLVGNAGVGKGTFTNIFLKETKLDNIRINCSDETSVDAMRTKVKSFATALGITSLKIVVLNECLDENEEILTGTLGNANRTLMKKLPDIEFDIISYNQETGNIENDKAKVISDKFDDVYEIELEDGRTVKATKNHPFLVKRNGNEMFVKLGELCINDEIVCI